VLAHRLPRMLAGSVALSLMFPSAAVGQWVASGDGPGQGRASLLPVPSPITATCASSSTIQVDWSVTAAAPLVVDFVVERSIDDGASWTGLGSVAATSVTSYSVIDDPLVAGTFTYVYRVTSRNNDWRATSAVSNSRTATVRLVDVADMCE
jgi:hypothetical protein